MMAKAVFLLITSDKEKLKTETNIHVRDAEDLLRLGFGDGASSVASFEANPARTDPALLG